MYINKRIHEISDEVLGNVLKASRFALVDANLFVDPHLAGAATSRAVVDLAVCRAEQRLVNARLGGQREVATTSRPSRHRALPVRTVLALHRDHRRAPLHSSAYKYVI